MSTITKEQAKDLRNAFECWQQDYDPAEDKEQYDMFGLGMVAMDALLASLEAEPVGYIDTEYAELLKSGHIESCSVYAEQGEGCIALFTAPPAPVSDYPDVLPCPVMLEPGLRFGKGVPTRTMLGALQRRSEYCAELDAMTPEQRAEHDAGMREFAAMFKSFGNSEQLNSPVIPDGLRLALSNAGIAAPESDEMLAATCEKYIQELVTWVKDRKPFMPAAPQQEV